MVANRIKAGTPISELLPSHLVSVRGTCSCIFIRVVVLGRRSCNPGIPRVRTSVEKPQGRLRGSSMGRSMSDPRSPMLYPCACMPMVLCAACAFDLNSAGSLVRRWKPGRLELKQLTWCVLVHVARGTGYRSCRLLGLRTSWPPGHPADVYALAGCYDHI